MLETSPQVQVLVDFLRQRAAPKGAKVLAAEAQRQPLAYALAIKLLPMASAEERRQLHQALLSAYPVLAGQPSLEQMWTEAKQQPRRFLQALYRILFADDGTFQAQSLRALVEALKLDFPLAVLAMLETVAGTAEEPRLHVKSFKMSKDELRDYGCLWAALGLSLLSQDDSTAAAEAFKQAAQQRRYATRTNLLAGRIFLTWLEAKGKLPNVVRLTEAFLLTGERESRAIKSEHQPYIEQLVKLYRLTGNAHSLETWARQLHESKPAAAPAPEVRHSLQEVHAYPDFLDDEPIGIDEWVVTDLHCALPTCDCGLVFLQVEADDRDCHGTFEVRLRYQTPSVITLLSDRPHCEHTVDLEALVRRCVTGPNEVRYLRHRGEQLKTLLRTHPREFDKKVQAAVERALPPTPDTADLTWVPWGCGIAVHGFTVEGVYLADGHVREPSAIQARLPVKSGPVGTPRWRLNYADASPQFRYEYLQWLAEGRPETHPDFAQLFLRGLERRYLERQEAEDVSRLPTGPLHFFLSARSGLEVKEDTLAAASYRLGLAVRRGEALSAEDALVWYREQHLKSQPEAVVRAFNALWPTLYREAFPQGLVLDKVRSRYRIEYECLNDTLSRSIYRSDTPAVDVSRTRLKDLLDPVAQGCLSQLAGFRRAGSGWTAYARLPRHVLAVMQDPILDEFDRTMDSMLGRVVPPSEWPEVSERLLQARGFGREVDGGVVVFRLQGPQTSPVAAGSAVLTALGLLRIGSALLADLGYDDMPRLLSLCQAGLQGDDAARLQAAWELYRTQRPSATRLKGPEDKAAIGQGLVDLVSAYVDNPDVVKRLEKAYTALGLDLRTLFSALHAAGTGGVRQRPSQGLDAALVQARLQETESVHGLLESIFAEDVPAPALDAAPAGWRLLLSQLQAKEAWSRSEVVDLAETLGVPPDGAIDTINDLSLERFDELVLEGDDPLYVNLALAARLDS